MFRPGIFIAFWLSLTLTTSSGRPLRGDEPPESATDRPPQTLDELLLFRPAKFPRGRWDERPQTCREVWFESADKTRIHGWYCEADQPAETILYCHGNSGNVTLYGPWMEMMRKERRLSILVFDYRGYGRSEGTPTIEGVLADARAARTELARLANRKPEQLIVWGRSLGGAVAVQIAAEAAPRALVLESTFSSFRDVAQVHQPRLAWLVPDERLNSVLAIRQVRCPILQSHGTADQVVPYDLGRKLHDAAPEPKTLLTFEGYDHFRQPDIFENHLDDFVKTLPR